MRTYRGQPRAIEEQLAADAQALAANGYYPKSTDFVPGTWGVGPWLFAILLIFVVGLGLVVLIYLILVKPDGNVTVIYELTPTRAPSATIAPVSSADIETRLRRLEDLRVANAITPEEYESKRAQVLAEL